MTNQIVRLLSIHMSNVNNIENGLIEIEKKHTDIDSINSRVIGIYGQNGSGKTSVIKALSILQILLSGQPLPKDSDELIKYGSDTLKCEFKFQILSDSENYEIRYIFELKKEEDTPFSEVVDPDKRQAFVSKETLTVSKFTNGKLVKRKTLVDYDAEKEDSFISPSNRFMKIFSEKTTFAKVNVARAISITQKKSFIFSLEFMNLLTEIPIDKKADIPTTTSILSAMQSFAQYNFCVIDNEDRGMIGMNIAIPVTISQKTFKNHPKAYVYLHEPTIFPADIFAFIKVRIEAISDVLGSMIPGFSIVVKSENQTMDDGKEGVRFELLSNRDGVKIPLRNESEGILKIISVLEVIAHLYNDPSVFVAIDELDAGIFEYLLGEILKVISETGKGQLLFTSHNLRPLEMIDSDSIVFTTTNPANRFIRFTNIRPTNNLRDSYIRAISLGGQKEEVYRRTNDWEIRKALRLSGVSIGSD